MTTPSTNQKSWSLAEWQRACYENSKAHGFHDPGINDTIASQLANIHGEVSEAWEETRKPDYEPTRVYFDHAKSCAATGCRNGKAWFVLESNGQRGEQVESPDGRNLVSMSCDACSGTGLVQKPEGLPSELADIVIRVFDTAQAWGIDLTEAVMMKHRYNISRPFRHGNKRS